MIKLHILTALILALKYGGGYAIPLWLALLPSYIYPAALLVILALGWFTGRLGIVAVRDMTVEKKDD